MPAHHADYLLVGGGVTSVCAAQSIRKHDPSGSITIVGAEANPPTDRPPLSKQFLLDDSWTTEDPESKAADFYEKNAVELRTGVKATAIDRSAKVLSLDGRGEIGYDKLLIATGAAGRRLNVPGTELDGVVTLRTVSDASGLRERMRKSRRALIVGGGYISLEVAAACVARGLEVVVISSADRPYARWASPTFGGFIADACRTRGVEFIFGDVPAFFIGSGRLEAVHTREGREIATDLAVVGIGAILNTSLAGEAGLEVDTQGAVLVDRHLQTADPAIWAAGDVASFPDSTVGKRRHVEHFLNAKWQGAAVGTSMAGEPHPYERIAYAYSDFFDLHLNIRGDTEDVHGVRVIGDLAAAEFVELYADADGVLRMTAAVSRDDEKLEKLSDAAEVLIQSQVQAAAVSPSEFGV